MGKALVPMLMGTTAMANVIVKRKIFVHARNQI
jgi:hypothetical protein